MTVHSTLPSSRPCMTDLLKGAEMKQFLDPLQQSSVAPVGELQIDSRLVQVGDIFAALPGKHVDGHDFILKAIEQGASTLLVSDQWYSSLEDSSIINGVMTVVVQDVLAFLGHLGHAFRQYYAAMPVIAITGSCGKTTVKNLIAEILKPYCSCVVTKKSQNNHLGVPMTLSRFHTGSELAVMELGANHVGEIQYTASMVKPIVSVLTCVNLAHIEGFGSLERTAIGKGEIVECLEPGGVAVLNRDDAFYQQWVDLCNEDRRWISFGRSPESDVQCLPEACVRFNETAVNFGVPKKLIGHKIPYAMPLFGEHNQLNAVIAITAMVGYFATQSPDWAAGFYENLPHLFEGIEPEPGRLVPIKLKNGTTVIDDTWNAVPAAVASSIDVLAQQPGPRWFVFGGMGELGEMSTKEHERVGQLAAACNIDQFWSFSEGGAIAAESFGKHGGGPLACFTTHDGLNAALSEAIQQHQPKTILVKGSRLRSMERVIKHLQTTFGCVEFMET